MEYSLSMTFLTETDDKQVISVSGVREDVSSEDASDLMDILLANDIFIGKKGALVSKYSAKLTERQVTKLDI